MNDAIDIIVLLEYGKRVVEIAKVYFIILYFLPGDLFNAIEDPRVGAGIIIYRNNIIAIFYKVNYCMRANISATAGPCRSPGTICSKARDSSEPWRVDRNGASAMNAA